jgi:hypothetical protein
MEKLLNILLAGLLVWPIGFGQVGSKKPSPSEIRELRAELEKMMREDQKLRTEVMAVEKKGRVSKMMMK